MNKYKKNDIITGIVTGIENYGIFVKLDEKNDGLIHISEITSSYVRNINDYAKIGETIKIKILDIDNNGRIKLSIKDLEYRVSKKKNEKILETTNGFLTLNNKLNEWINNKIEEISKKKQKNVDKENNN